MNINIKNPKDLLLCGVYCIKNIKNNKLYIGSTTVQFVKRLNLHVWELNSNKHKNKYLQNSWNKGLTKKDINYSFLKVPKTITNNLKQAHINTSIRSRERSPEIYVYDLNYNYLGKWNSSKDLEDWSKTKYNNLPINSRFKTKRMGVPIKYLMSVNINKSCKTNKSYKGLYFTYKPLHQVIDDKKQDELLEV